MLTLEDYDDNTYDLLTILNVTVASQKFNETSGDWSKFIDKPGILRTLWFGRCLHYPIIEEQVTHQF